MAFAGVLVVASTQVAGTSINEVLTTVTAETVRWVAGALGIELLREGTTLLGGEVPVYVTEGCASAVVMLNAATLALLASLYTESTSSRPLRSSTVVGLIAFGIVANVVRLLALVAILEGAGASAARAAHGWLGLVLYAVCLVPAAVVLARGLAAHPPADRVGDDEGRAA